MKMIVLIVFMGSLWLGYKWGWVAAHITVARECEKLGGFYVNNKTYKCTEVKEELENEKAKKQAP